MISVIELRNFRCFETTGEVPLKPLTVLIGQNDSGKSAFLDALQKGVTGAARPSRSDWGKMKRPPSWLFRTRSGSSYETVVNESGGFDSHQPITELQPVETYRLASPGIPMSAPGIQESSNQDPQLSPNGENLAAILDYVLRQDRKRFADIESALTERVSGLESWNLRTPKPATREIEFKLQDGLVLPGSTSSTGV